VANFLVTGGAGFIGSHLVELLIKHDNSVTVIDNLSTGALENLATVKDNVAFKFFEIDINLVTLDFFKEDTFDGIFHLAALADIVPSISDPVSYFEANVSGTLRMLELARKNNSKFVYAASSSCYGLAHTFPTNEEAAINPMYPYSLTKYMGEELVLHWSEVYSVDAVSLRLFNVYGARLKSTSNYGAVMKVFLAQKRAGLPLTVVGDGSQKRDFVNVLDVAEAFYKAFCRVSTFKVYNVGSGSPVTVSHIADKIGGEIVYIPWRPGEPKITHADISRITSSLGWSPQIDLDEGIKSVLEHNSFSTTESEKAWTQEEILVQTSDWFRFLNK
jgi:UDP-glucose 4-epimerase